jgi:CheY-like chemotaxis protein
VNDHQNVYRFFGESRAIRGAEQAVVLGASDYVQKPTDLDEHRAAIVRKVALDGSQALTMLADSTFEPSLIILDLNMPLVSGYEVLKRNPRKDIPIVVFSPSFNSADADRSIALGAREYAGSGYQPFRGDGSKRCLPIEF